MIMHSYRKYDILYPAAKGNEDSRQAGGHGWNIPPDLGELSPFRVFTFGLAPFLKGGYLTRLPARFREGTYMEERFTTKQKDFRKIFDSIRRIHPDWRWKDERKKSMVESTKNRQLQLPV